MRIAAAVLFACCCSTSALPQAAPRPAPAQRKTIPISTSKRLLEPVPGVPQRTNTLPVSMAVSPDGRYLAVLNAGYGAREANYAQSIAVLDLQTKQLADFPDPRLGNKAHQTYFVGIAFSGDGQRVFASVASLTDPTGEKQNDTGSGIAVYSFTAGKLAPERFIKLPPQQVAAGKRLSRTHKNLPPGTANPYPAGLALVSAGGATDAGAAQRLLVAGNLSDNVMTIDPGSGEVSQRFDLSTSNEIPASYPYAVVATHDGKRAWVSLWNASRVAELDLEHGSIARMISLLPDESSPTAPSSHPTALLLSRDDKTLFVTLSTRDRVAAVDSASGRVLRTMSTRLPGQQYAGNYPDALAESGDGKWLFAANASSNCVAVFDLTSTSESPAGFIPTEWYPTALLMSGENLVIAAGKGSGAGPNSEKLPASDPVRPNRHGYIAGIMNGSVAVVRWSEAQRNLAALTAEVLDSNLMRGPAAQFHFAGGHNPIHHAIYIIKENRTYDQIFGDIKEGNGDPSLVMYGEAITPNQHKLARQFGVIDNFYDSGEVSANGHEWSTAAITTEYLERTWPIQYRSDERGYDSEGWLSDELPVLQGLPNVSEAGTGYLWTNAARHRVIYRDYGEFVAGVWCDKAVEDLPANAPPPETQSCPVKYIEKGQPLPAYLGDPHGSPSPFPWKVPLLGNVIPTKPELRGHVDPHFAPWSLEFPDQLRVDEFLNEFAEFVNARKQHSGTELPALVIVRMGNDHTAGTRAGIPKPEALVADNDLAVGRLVEAVSNSPYWDDTAIFVLEDDAQNGADHVDAHRSTALAISKYSPGSIGKPFVDHSFYTTVHMIHTIEALIGLPPMNNNDAHAPVMAPLFTGAGTQSPFKADFRNRDNGLIYEVNGPHAPGAEESAKLDFSHADVADVNKLNRILWRAAKGKRPMPKPRHTVIPAGRDDD